MSPPDQELNPEPPADHFAKPKFTPAVNDESVTKDFIGTLPDKNAIEGAINGIFNQFQKNYVGAMPANVLKKRTFLLMWILMKLKENSKFVPLLHGKAW